MFLTGKRVFKQWFYLAFSGSSWYSIAESRRTTGDTFQNFSSFSQQTFLRFLITECCKCIAFMWMNLPVKTEMEPALGDDVPVPELPFSGTGTLHHRVHLGRNTKIAVSLLPVNRILVMKSINCHMVHQSLRGVFYHTKKETKLIIKRKSALALSYP